MNRMQEQQTAPDEAATFREKVMAMPRSQKRHYLRIRHGADRRPFARPRSGLRTGTTRHFEMWMADLRAVSILQHTKLDLLAEDETGEVAAAFAIIRVSSRLRSVWDLARADLSTLLAIPQIGPARLEEVESYLKARNVPLKWTVS